MNEIQRMMNELNESYRKRDWSDMCNIIQLELLDALKSKAEEQNQEVTQ